MRRDPKVHNIAASNIKTQARGHDSATNLRSFRNINATPPPMTAARTRNNKFTSESLISLLPYLDLVMDLKAQWHQHMPDKN
jgi:hypothetical protein